jgi:glycosyltransferase involved in cell wall biosynthesis
VGARLPRRLFDLRAAAVDVLVPKEGKRRRRAVYLATEWPSALEPAAGIFIREHALATQLHCDVSVVHLSREPAESGLYDVIRVGDDALPVWRVRYRRFGRPLSYVAFLRGARAAVAAAEQTLGRSDVLHANSFLSACAALLIGRRRRRPVIYSEHWSIFLPENPGVLTPGQLRLARFALSRADVVLPVSEHLATAFRRLEPGARYRVIRNTFDDRVFHPPTPRPPARTTRRLLTVGLLNGNRKGVDILLESIALLAGSRGGLTLDVIGDGSDRPQLEALAHRLGISEVVAFHGARTKPEIAEHLREADLFVLASRYENNPCAVIEALACGLPVVAPRVGGLPEIVDEHNGLLARPLDAADLAEHIAAALDRDGWWDRREIAARALRSYGRAAVGAAIADAYERALRRSPSAA